MIEFQDGYVTTIKNVLTPTQLQYCKNKVIELDQYFLKHENENCFHNRLGSFTEFKRKEILENYRAMVQRYNPLLWEHFEEIYKALANNISNFLGIKCCYDKERLFLPGFRTFIPKKLGVLQAELKMFHYDRNIHNPNWEEIIGKKIDRSASITVIVEIPDYSFFEYIDKTQNNDYELYNKKIQGNVAEIEKIENLYEKIIKIRNYEGDAVFQWNHVIHRMGDLKFSSFDQKRTSIQISLLYDNEKLWLTW
jgi:hypothetical protein